MLRTPKRNHVNPSAPPSPSDGESACGALGSRRHTRSSAIPRECISASTPPSWHDARAGAVGSAFESAAPARLERCVNSTDASGPASVHMCYDIDAVAIVSSRRLKSETTLPCTRARPSAGARVASGRRLPCVLQIMIVLDHWRFVLSLCLCWFPPYLSRM